MSFCLQHTLVATLPSQDLPRIHLLHPPDHQRDTWRSNAKFARRLASSTLGIPHELGALGDLGGREGGTSWFAHFSTLLVLLEFVGGIGGYLFEGHVIPVITGDLAARKVAVGAAATHRPFQASYLAHHGRQVTPAHLDMFRNPSPRLIRHRVAMARVWHVFQRCKCFRCLGGSVQDFFPHHADV